MKTKAEFEHDLEKCIDKSKQYFTTKKYMYITDMILCQYDIKASFCYESKVMKNSFAII